MIIEQKSSFPQLAEGLHPVVISEVREVEFDDIPFDKADHDKVKAANGGKFPKKTMLSVRFSDEDGVSAEKLYTPSLGQKANLAKDLKSIQGSVPAKLDTKDLIGIQARVLTVDSVTSKGTPRAKVESLMKPLPGQAVPLPKGKAAAAPAPAVKAQVEEKLNITDDDIPF